MVAAYLQKTFTLFAPSIPRSPVSQPKFIDICSMRSSVLAAQNARIRSGKVDKRGDMFTLSREKVSMGVEGQEMGWTHAIYRLTYP